MFGLMLVLIIGIVGAQQNPASDFEYDITQNGDGLVINRYIGTAAVVNIPAVIEDFPVKEIPSSAFSGNEENNQRARTISKNSERSFICADA
jgi:hypothetical protein